MTGKYHTHFGAYPILEIALERALTESFQGRNVDSFARNEDFIYGAKDVFSYKNVYNDLKRGDYIKTPEFFVGECKYQYNKNMGFEGTNNAELLEKLIGFFEAEGCRVLVRNASSLGFPTYNVFIPTYSEVIFHSLSKKYFSSFAHSKTATGILRDLKNAKVHELPLLLLHIDEMKKLSTVNEGLFNFANCANLMLKCSNDESTYLMAASLAYVYYSLGNVPMALGQLDKFYSLTDGEDAEYLLCLRRYLSMRVNNYDNETAKKLVEAFHKKETVSKLWSYIEKNANPFEDFVLSCDCKSCETCMLAHCCKQVYTRSIIDLVNENSKRLDFDDFVDSIKKYSLK